MINDRIIKQAQAEQAMKQAHANQAGDGGAKGQPPRGSGIEANLSETEDNLTHCLGLLQHINSRF